MNHFNHQIQRLFAAAALIASVTWISSVSGLFAAPASGADTFKAKCAMCHGSDGSGNTPMGQKLKIRDLRSHEVQQQTDDQLAGFIVNGKPPMPAYGKTLTSGDIHELVAFIRSIANRG